MVKPMWINRSDGTDRFRNPELTDVEFNTGIEQMMQTNLQTLWQSATAWQEQFISNAAYGLLAMGCMANKPKALACLAWINNIWMNHYYIQKPLVTYDYPGYDFSVCGPMPYTVPELTVEMLG